MTIIMHYTRIYPIVAIEPTIITTIIIIFVLFSPMHMQRLYCPTCQETYSLPQRGTIKLFKELKCPLDQFELVLFSLGEPNDWISG